MACSRRTSNRPADWTSAGLGTGTGLRRSVGAASCALLLLLTGGVQHASADPAVVGTKTFTEGEPLAVGVHQGRDKLYVTEDNAGLLYILDGTTLATLNTVPVGGSAFDIAVNETNEKVYVASSRNSGTPALTDGNGLISVIDADTNQLLTTIDPGTHTSPSFFVLANNEVSDKVYVAFKGGIGVIDTATDAYTLLSAATTAADHAAVNTVTNRVYFNQYGSNSVAVVDGTTLPNPSVSTMSLAFTGGSGPLDVAVSEAENKLYVTMLHVPGQGEIGILIIDLDTNAYSFVGAEDLEPLVFDQTANRLFAGVQVGQKGAVVDGATDALTYVDFGGAGFGAGALRASSDNAYYANGTRTFAVNGATRCSIALDTGGPLRGGLIVNDIAVNQATGRVYVTNDQEVGKVTAIADGTVPCDTQPPGGSTPPPPPDTLVDNTAPRFAIGGRRSQRVLRQRGVRIVVTCSNEPCTATARGSVSVPGSARLYRFRSAGARIPQGGHARLKLAASKRVLRAIRRGLRAGRKLAAKVAVTARDAQGNAATKRRTIRLRR
jgi:DNA-binding beta-propeller fold protein YncE